MYPYIQVLGHLIQTYWVMVTLGITAGMIFIWFQSRKSQNSFKIISTVFLSVLVGLITAHISSYLIWYPEYIKKYPIEMLKFWAGGLTFHGGLAGGIISLMFFASIFKISSLKVLDISSPAVALGQFFGRIGCFLNSCCYGRPTNMPWGVTFTRSDSIAPIMIKLHPTQLYEAAGVLAVFIILLKMKKKKSYNGRIFLNYLIMYSLLRMAISYFRADSHYSQHPHIRTVYIICFFTIIISLAICYYLKHKTAKKKAR